MSKPFALLLTILAASAAQAHDFWLEPSTFRPQAGQIFSVGLRVGQNFEGDALPRSASLIESFTLREAAMEHAVNGSENQDPAGYVRLLRPGVATIGYRSKPSPLELTAEKFNRFLVEEGVNAPRATTLRREQFQRFAKAIVGSGDGATLLSKPFGWRFEIVPESNPHDAGSLRVRVMLDQRPLRGALVSAIRRGDAARVSVRTSPDGRATIALPGSGVWLIKCVAVVESESLWASLTFAR
jgi:uncharacterized GH25 family protein